MSTVADILARSTASPVYVLEWECRGYELAAALGQGETGLNAAAGTFTGWPSFGYAEFDDGTGEILAWSGVSEDGATLRNLRRGLHRSGDSDHGAGAVLREYGFWRELLSKPHAGFPNGLDVLRPPRLGTLGIDPQKRSASLSATNITLVEAPHPDDLRAAFLADLIAHANGPHGNGIRDRKVTLKLGFEELADPAEFRTIARAVVAGVQVQRQGTEIALSLRPLHGELKDRRLFEERRTRLAEAIDAAATTIEVADSQALPDPGGETAWARIDEEIVSYSGISGSHLTGVARGVFGSLAAAHDLDENIKQVRYLASGHPLTRFLQILTSTGAGTNGAYDVLPKDEGLALDESLVDVAGIEAVRDDLVPQTRVAFVVTEEVGDAKAWLEEELLVPAGCALTVDASERLSLAFYGPPLPQQQLDAFGPGDSVEGVALDADLNFAGVINAVEVRYSLDSISEKYRSRVLIIDNDSIQAHGPARKLVLELGGVHGIDSPVDSDPVGDSVAALVASRLISRYASPRREIAWNAPAVRAGVGVAALVEVSEDRLPAVIVSEQERRHASKGNTATLYEVVSRSVDYSRGVVGLRLLESEFTGARYLILHDDAAPGYAGADVMQKRYGYLAGDDDDATSLNNAPHVFADGGEAYRLYPA